MDILQNNKPGQPLQKPSGLDYWFRLWLGCYIVTMPFISAFALTDIVSLPLIFAFFLFLLMVARIIKTGKLPLGFGGYDLLIICLFFFLTGFSYIMNGWGNPKSLNHTIAYFSSFLLFYVTIKFAFFSIRDQTFLLKRILQLITYTTLVSALFGNAEFILWNGLGIDLNKLVPRPNELEASYNVTVLGFFHRARGFAPESGHFTFMLELFSPLTIYYLYFSGFCKWNRIIKILCVAVIILSFIFAVSTASFVILPVAFLLAAIIYARSIIAFINAHLQKVVLVTAGTAAAVLLLNYLFSVYTLIFSSITDKMDSNSFDDRQDRINFFFQQFSRLDVMKKMYGTGPSGATILGFDESKSILSLYYSITFELGFLGLLLLSLLFGYVVIHSLKIKSKIGYFLLVSLISGILHYYFIANYWYPWFWFICIVTLLYSHFTNNPSAVSGKPTFK